MRFKLILLTFILNLINKSVQTDPENWDQLIKSIDSSKYNYLKETVKYFSKTHRNQNISSDCQNSIQQIFNAFENSEEWVYSMINSWSKFPPTGIVTGTLTDFGDFDQCINVKPNSVIDQPQYCLVDISIPVPKPIGKHQNFYHSVEVLPKSFNTSDVNSVFVKFSKTASFFYWFFIRNGICVPKKCSEQDLKTIAEPGIKSMGLILKDISCQTKHGFEFDWIQMIAFAFFLSSIVLAIFATIYTKYFFDSKNDKTFYGHALQTFSLELNFKRLISAETNQEISCIHGIRVMTILWVIFGHTIEWTFLGFYRNIFSLKTVLTQPISQPFLQAYYAVETFFFLSGLFTSYITLKFTNGNIEKFNTIGFTIYRLLRLTPQLVIFILLTFLLPILGSGPIWYTHIDPIVNNCRKNWWHNLLYMQTFLSIDASEKQLNMCGLHTWFIATDMQFFWMSIPIVLILLRNFKFGLLTNFITIIVFSLIASILMFINDYPAAHIFTSKADFMFDDKEWNPFFKMFFWKPWPHASVYFAGLLFGNYVAKKKHNKVKNQWLIWCLVFIGYIFCFYDSLFWAYGQPNNRFVSSILYPLKRLVWSINLSAVIWMCITGNGHYINRFLAAKAFIPLSRLTYCVYLTHAWVVWTFWGSRRDLVDINIYTIMSIYLTILFVSYLLGAVFSLLYESPFLMFQSYLRQYLLANDEKIADLREDTINMDVNQNLMSKA